jgi:predicted metal-dependent phosphoesterase TrpH
MLIDLQLHSNYSDGYLAPFEVAKMIRRHGIKTASLTDHNTIRGQAEFRAACGKIGIKAIPGLELYATLGRVRFNVLWYNYSDDPDLHSLLRETQIRRKNQVRRVLTRLISLGFRIDIEKTLDRFMHYMPVNRLSDELWKHSLNRKIIRKELGSAFPRESEIIKNYFYNPRISVLRESYLNVERIVKLRNRIGGQLILNHPAKYHWIKTGFWEKLKKLGFDGIELLSPHHSLGAVMHMQALARNLGFIETGGSDFHKLEGGGHALQHSWQYFKIDSKYLRGVEKIIG